MITLQAVIIAYTDDFKLLMILSLSALPLVLLLRKPGGKVEIDHTAVME
jgi:DHA2 family multidrug resistance protein